MPEQSITANMTSQGSLGPAGQAVFVLAPIGPLWLAWAPDGLTMVRFGGEAPSGDTLRRWMPDPSPLPERPLPSPIEDALRGYARGQPVDPAALPVRISGTAFQRRVWTALRHVPRGAVTTYGALARAIDSTTATRAIGMAMGQNPLPIVVPCHRVIAAGGRLGGFSGGLEIKRVLLGLEGVRVEGERVQPAQLSMF